MAATQTVPQEHRHCNFIPIKPQRGVMTLFGYGIKVHVDRGHLMIQDGVGPVRREVRLPRVGHGLRRLVVIGADGMVSLAALRWLADQDAAFVMLDRDGTVLVVTGPVSPSDARLRRAQAQANPGTALRIARKLIEGKLDGQEQLVRSLDAGVADLIAQVRSQITKAETAESLRQLESQAATAYWSAWHSIPVRWSKRDEPRVPGHWCSFGTRLSPLSGSPRKAINPPNAILNYLYAVLESEARLAAAALGLDPGLGLFHVDSRTRDSLACDLMEPVRPQVDGYVLDWIRQQPLNRKWFFEQRDGTARLMGPFAVELSRTAQAWGQAVAPVAEWVAREIELSSTGTAHRSSRPAGRSTRLTERRSHGSSSTIAPPPRPPAVCRECGTPVAASRTHCSSCAPAIERARLVEAAQLGRAASHTPEAEARRARTQRRHAEEGRAWQATEPNKLSPETYIREIEPRLRAIKLIALTTSLGISKGYATAIRAGRRRPHPRHWQTLARLVGVAPDE